LPIGYEGTEVQAAMYVICYKCIHWVVLTFVHRELNSKFCTGYGLKIFLFKLNLDIEKPSHTVTTAKTKAWTVFVQTKIVFYCRVCETQWVVFCKTARTSRYSVGIETTKMWCGYTKI
jgi:hypothetical protein